MDVNQVLTKYGVHDHPPACKLVVLALVDDVLTRKHIAERVGLSIDGVGRAVSRLEGEGVIVTQGTGTVATGGRPAELVTLADITEDDPLPPTRAEA